MDEINGEDEKSNEKAKNKKGEWKFCFPVLRATMHSNY